MHRLALTAMAVCAPGCGGEAGIVPQMADASFEDSLRGTGLWSDFANEVLAEGVRPYQPQFELWSDGASQRRWVYLPPGRTIDSSDMDSWKFPVGTKLWQELTRDGKRVETRLLELTGEGSWSYQSYRWTELDSDALLADATGEDNVRGTGHDIPSIEDCALCHARTPHVVLGFGAIQLDHEPSQPGFVAMEALVGDELLSDPPVGQVPHFSLDADAVTAAAVGYLHGNCGSCHNGFGAGVLDGSMDFWRRVEDVSFDAVVERYNVVGVDATKDVPEYPAALLRVDPSSPSTSQVYVRMRQEVRGSENQMPPVGSEEEDLGGIAVVSDWIEALVP